MTDLNHDASGFLVGPRLTDDLDKISRELELLRAIRGDTQETVEQLGRLVDALSGIDAVSPAEPTRQALGPRGPDDRLPRDMTPALPGAAPDAPLAPVSAPGVGLSLAPTDITPLIISQTPSVPGASHVAAPRARDENGRFTPTAPAQQSIATPKPVVADPVQARIDREKVDRQRDKSGRFGKTEDSDKSPTGESRSSKALGAASESIKNAAEGLAHGADNIDPAVSAAKELGGIVAPVINTVKPLGRLFGRGRSPEEKNQKQSVMWYRRIWGELRDSNKKSSGRGMGLLVTGLLSLMGMLLSPLRALARMTGLLRAAGALGGLAKGLGGLRGGRGGRGANGTSAPGKAGRAAKGGKAGPGGADVRTRRDAINERGQRTAGARTVQRNPETGRFESVPAKGRDGKPSVPGKPGVPGSTPAQGKTAPAEAKAGKPGASVAVEGAKVPKDKPASTASAKPSKVARVASGAGKMGMGLLRKLPYIGALLGAGMFASAAMAKDDPNATPEERQANKTERYGSMGGIAGGLLGGVLGLVGGPAGAIAGGMLGDQLGTAVGEWLSTVDMDTTLASITTAFQGWADDAKKLAGRAFEYVQGKWDNLVTAGGKVLSDMGDWVKDKWGKVAETYNNVKDTVQDKVQTGKDYVASKAAAVKDAGQNAVYKATGGRLGTEGSEGRKAELIKAMDASGITDPREKAALMANADHEGQGFTKNEENLNYSAKRLQDVFPKYYKDAESARADAGNPEAIANKVYGGRMGNTDPGDGYKFRGRTDIGLTGKANYEAMGKKLGVDLVSNPELANDPKYRAQIAVQYWKDSGAGAAARSGDIVGARKKVNGGTNGLDDVEAKYDKYLAQAQAGELTPTRQANEVRVAPPVAANDAINRTLATVKGQPGAGSGAAPTFAPGRGPIPIPGVGAVATASPAAGVPAGVPTAPTSVLASVTKLSQAQPVGVMPIPTATVAPVSVGASPASSTAKPLSMMSTVAPTTIAPLQVPSYSAPAPDASQTRITPTPQVAKPLMGPNKAPSAPTPLMMMPLTQNVADRSIAHAATGGIGMGGDARL